MDDIYSKRIDRIFIETVDMVNNQEDSKEWRLSAFSNMGINMLANCLHNVSNPRGYLETVHEILEGCLDEVLEKRKNTGG